VVTTLLYSVTPHDTVTFIGAPVALLLAVGIATLVPARRALRSNPADVMRAE
jgi:ABC-type lipoprotein release transport system permease subunit